MAKAGGAGARPPREAQRGVPSADNSAVESFWIRVAGEDGEGAVDLLGQQHAGEFVRHGERGEGDFLFGAGTQFGGEAFGVAAEEDDFARAAIAQIAQPARELLGGELLSGRVEQHHRGGRIDLQFAKRGGAGVAEFADFDLGVMLNALDVVVHHGAGFYAAGLAEHNQSDFHFVNTDWCVGAGPAAAGPAPTFASIESATAARNSCVSLTAFFGWWPALRRRGRFYSAWRRVSL